MGKAELRLEVDELLMRQVVEHGVDLKLTVEAALRRELAAQESAKRWTEDNADAIEAHNARIAERGVFGDDLRRW
jgi:post-segregation antitoxin (ccd killing protein)